MKHINTMKIWQTMSRKEIRQLAVAVFFLFATIGPLSLLMDKSIVPVPWWVLFFQTILSGAFAACIILFIGKPFRTFLVIAGFVVVQLTYGILQRHILPSEMQLNAGTQIVLAAEEIDLIAQRRTIAGVMAIILIGVGYGLFIRVVSRENTKRAEAQAEITIAQNIQKSLLPETGVQTSWCTIDGKSVSAKEVGGDIFDVIILSEDEIFIFLADASGHGTGAGILSAMTKSSILQELLHTRSPGSVLGRVNETIFRVSERNMFVTCAAILLSRSQQRATLCTAGHPAVLHRNAKGIVPYRTPNVALGLIGHVDYQEINIPFDRDEELFIYSDGVTEARNSQNELLGESYLLSLIEKSPRSADAGEYVETVCHTTGIPSDDITVVKIRFL